MRSGSQIQELLERIQGEYLQLPGLRLTPVEARQLWSLDRTMCEALFGALVDARFLGRAADGCFVKNEPPPVTRH
jgi:hypothetical protein